MLICFTWGTTQRPYGCSVISLMPPDVVIFWQGIDWLYSKEWIQSLCLRASSVQESSVPQRADTSDNKCTSVLIPGSPGVAMHRRELISYWPHADLAVMLVPSLPLREGPLRHSSTVRWDFRSPHFVENRHSLLHENGGLKRAFPSTQQSSMGA